MDNLCHTLVGAALAEAGFKRRTSYGTATLLIAANLPDLDALVFLTGTPSVSFRRGWTHGVLADAILPIALTATMVAWDRLAARRKLDAGQSRCAACAVVCGPVLAHPPGFPEHLRHPPADAVLWPREAQTVQVAYADPKIRAILTWARFPYYEIEPSGDGAIVTLRDLRFGGGLGSATVRIAPH